jgi:hypothetical protein
MCGQIVLTDLQGVHFFSECSVLVDSSIGFVKPGRKGERDKVILIDPVAHTTSHLFVCHPKPPDMTTTNTAGRDWWTLGIGSGSV